VVDPRVDDVEYVFLTMAPLLGVLFAAAYPALFVGRVGA
jgi:hypothetical protein